VNLFANGTVIGSSTSLQYTAALDVLTPGKITLQAQAVDVWGAGATSAPVVITVTGQGLQTPPTSGLALWLRADQGVTTNSDGTVSLWADQSGQGNDATLANSTQAPILVTDPATGNPVLQFNGTNTQYLQVASTPSMQGDLSTFCAFNLADVAGTHALWSKTSGGVPFPWIFSVYSGGLVVLDFGGNAGHWSCPSTAYVSPGMPVVAGVTVSGAVASFYVDGEPGGQAPIGAATFDQGEPLVIGALDSLGWQFAGTISDLLIYTRALTDDEVLDVNL
jgi:hypothetical protein